MKNLLIPTDYTLISLEEATHAVRQLEGKYNIILFHAFDMPGSLMEVMMRTNALRQQVLVTEQLRQRCKRIKQQNSQIGQIYFRPMYGNTVAAFRNYLLANEIDLIVLPADYRFVPVLNESVNPLTMFAKAGVEVYNAHHTLLQPHHTEPSSLSNSLRLQGNNS